jgi:hypothetical protein
VFSSQQPAALQALAYAATLAAISLIAGWFAAFRNRPYVGWLGAAFLCFAVLAHLRVHEVVVPRWPFLTGAGVCFALAFYAAARETARRLREIQEDQRAAEEALVEMIRLAVAKEKAAEAQGKEGNPPPAG